MDEKVHTSRQRGHFAVGRVAFSPSTIVTDPDLQAHIKQKMCPQVKYTGSNTVS